jgi:HEPN domain-containing protein
MNRDELQKLTDLRLKEAKVLLDAKCYNGAYYLMGYAVECALKACIAKQTKQHDFPNRDSRDFYIHNLNNLLKYSGFEKEHRDETKEDRAFDVNWATVKDWKEDTRYSLEITKDKAEALYFAITNGKGGIMPWLRRYW